MPTHHETKVLPYTAQQMYDLVADVADTDADPVSSKPGAPTILSTLHDYRHVFLTLGIGILLVAVGFGFRVNALVVVLAAGVVTGLAAGFSLREVVAMIGTPGGAKLDNV